MIHNNQISMIQTLIRHRGYLIIGDHSLTLIPVACLLQAGAAGED
jgi:hypothetical protein